MKLITLLLFVFSIFLAEANLTTDCLNVVNSNLPANPDPRDQVAMHAAAGTLYCARQTQPNCASNGCSWGNNMCSVNQAILMNAIPTNISQLMVCPAIGNNTAACNANPMCAVANFNFSMGNMSIPIALCGPKNALNEFISIIPQGAMCEPKNQSACGMDNKCVWESNKCDPVMPVSIYEALGAKYMYDMMMADKTCSPRNASSGDCTKDDMCIADKSQCSSSTCIPSSSKLKMILASAPTTDNVKNGYSYFHACESKCKDSCMDPCHKFQNQCMPKINVVLSAVIRDQAKLNAVITACAGQAGFDMLKNASLTTLTAQDALANQANALAGVTTTGSPVNPPTTTSASSRLWMGINLVLAFAVSFAF